MDRLQMNKIIIIVFLALISLVGCNQAPETEITSEVSPNIANSNLETNPPVDENQSFSIILNTNTIGKMDVLTKHNTDNLESSITVDYSYSNNGRGETYHEEIKLDAAGYPVNWTVKGNSTFGNAINEYYSLIENNASWADSTGSGTAEVNEPTLYVTQFGSEYTSFILANALLRDEDQRSPTLPAGELSLTLMENIEIATGNEKMNLSTYALSGADLNPEYFILDNNAHLFAYIAPSFIIVRSGFEDQDVALRALAEKYSTQRYEKIQSEVAHQYSGNVRIRNVRIFNPDTLSLTEPVSVVVVGEQISSIDSLSIPTKESETEIDGNGGSLIPGLFDMHGHMGAEEALLNVAAGVTSVRDMGNSNEVLEVLVEKIESGILTGPRITRYGFIEGKSEFSANGGIIVENQEQAIAAVRTYADKGFPAIKLYNSMNGDWTPAIAKEAHRLNMSVSGHVPAFSNANAMIEAGYDELTHINQVMLGWVLKPDEDTRSLLRFTAMKRFPQLDLKSNAVQKTINLMVDNGVAIDPTMAIHELGLTTRNGVTRVGVADYIDNMPPAVQRNAKVALFKVENEKDDQDYRAAYQMIVATVKMMKERGIQLLPGTDMGGAFNLHRELEIYQAFGMSPAEVVKLGSTDMADYLGQEQLGRIEEGKLADFFLIPGDPTREFKAIKTISMVSKGGVFYYPSEIYPKFGIKPFTNKPTVK